MDNKKRIILNTKQANEIDFNRKKFKYYFDKPIQVKKKSTLKHQGTHYITNDPSLAYTNGILNLKDMNVEQATIVQSGFTNVYAQFYTIDLSTNDVHYNGNGTGAIINVAVFKDWGGGQSPPPYRIEVANIIQGGSGYSAGDTFTIHQSTLGGSDDSSITFNITNVMNSQKYLDDTGKLVDTNSISFDSNYYEYSAFQPGIISQYTTNLGQGAEVRFGVDAARVPYTYEIITSGHSFSVGTVLWIDKNKIYYDVSQAGGYYTPQKITITSVTPPNAPTSSDPTKSYLINIKGLLNDVGNITNSKRTADMIAYTSKRNNKLTNEKVHEYKIGDLDEQIIMGIELEFKNVVSDSELGLSVVTDAIIDLIIE